MDGARTNLIGIEEIGVNCVLSRATLSNRAFSTRVGDRNRDNQDDENTEHPG
jgi:hypothetical protein